VQYKPASKQQRFISFVNDCLASSRKKQLLADDRTKRNQSDTLKLFTSGGGEKTETIGRAVLTYSSSAPTSGRAAQVDFYIQR
jgi:hypothetical protein